METSSDIDELRRLFSAAPFIAELGIELQGGGGGRCETVLQLQPRHLQQDGFVHAGVQATMADHTAGGAAATLARPGHIVLTAELGIHLLRPARGERLECVATVLRAGRLLTIAESEVYCVSDAGRVLVAKASATLANVERDAGAPGLPEAAAWR